MGYRPPWCEGVGAGFIYRLATTIPIVYNNDVNYKRVGPTL